MKTTLGKEAFSNLSAMLGQLIELFGEDIVGVLRDLFTKLLGKDGRTYLAVLKKLTRGELFNPYLGPVIASGMLGATTGQGLWTRVTSFFTGGVDPDFTNWGLTDDQAPTSKTPFVVFPLKKAGRFDEIFKGFGLDLKLLAWQSFDQVMAFSRDHVDLLHPKGYGTFFLCQVGGKLFVANVFWNDGGLLNDGCLPQLSVRRLSDDDVRNTEFQDRFVFPQQS